MTTVPDHTPVDAPLPTCLCPPHYVLGMAESGALPPRPPTGDVTLLYTDIEKSTNLASRVGDSAWRRIQQSHHALVRTTLEHEGGYEQTEQGDGFLYLFTDTAAACRGALALQNAFVGTALGHAVKLRIGLHHGTITSLPQGGISGLVTSQASRIAAAPQGGQIVCSATVLQRLGGHPDLRAAFPSWGLYLVDDIDEPVELFVWTCPDTTYMPLRVRRVGADETPKYATPLVGRAADLKQLGSALADGTAPVITLTGTGGVGKTRLAVEFLRTHPTRKSFLNLSAATDAATFLTTIVESLGLRVDSDTDLLEIIIGEFQVRPRLVVLDNFEQVLDAASLLQRIVDRCAASQFIITSRSPLSLRQELTFEVLPLPADDLRSPALVLFSELIGDGYEGDYARADIHQLCRMLDGLPLALELAATRAKKVGLAAIYSELQEPMSMLRHRRRNDGDRHSSMQAAIQWSYTRLDDAAQRLFRSLAALDGTCTAENLRQISGLDNHDVIDALDALVDHRLVTLDTATTETSRFSMLQLMRAFGREELAGRGETESVHASIADVYLDLARRAETGLIGPQRLSLQTELEAELDNIRSVLARSRDGDEGRGTALKLAASLVTYWWHEHLSEGLDWLIELSKPCDDIEPPLRARGLVRAGLLATSCGRADEALTLFEEGVDLARASWPRAQSTLSHGLQQLAVVRSALGDSKAALALADEGLELELDVDRGAAAVYRANFADVLAAEDNDLQAERLFQESVDLFVSSGDEWLRASPLGRLGEIALRAGDLPGALELFNESVAMWRRADGRSGMPRSLSGLSRALCHLDADTAAAVGRESYELALSVGAPGEAHWSFFAAAKLLHQFDADPCAIAEMLGATVSLGRAFGHPVHPHIDRELIDLTGDLRASMGDVDYDLWFRGGESLDTTAALSCGQRAWDLVDRNPT